MNKIIIKNAKVVFPEVVKNRHIIIQDGIITYVGDFPDIGDDDTVIDARDKYILPGFIDIHSHGAVGFDATIGLYNKSTGEFLLDPEHYQFGLQKAVDFFVKTGTTKKIFTTMASPIESLEMAFEQMNDFVLDAKSFFTDIFAGINVEGTFTKMEQYRGAQNADYFYPPTVELFKRLQKTAKGKIKIVNVPPEHGEAGFELIDYLNNNDIIAAAGHTGATAQQYEKAVEHGLSLAVHFLNGPTGSSTKPFFGGGAVEAVLRNANVFVELIADGYHVSPSYVLDTIRRKGFRNTILITDSMFVAGMTDVDTFQVCGINGKVSANKEYLQVVESENTLFGSILTMDKAFSNILNWLTQPVDGIWQPMHIPHDFESALINTSRMCSQIPARLLGIYRPEERIINQDLSDYTGSIEVGKKADIIIASITQKDTGYNLEIDSVFLKGEKVDMN